MSRLFRKGVPLGVSLFVLSSILGLDALQASAQDGESETPTVEVVEGDDRGVEPVRTKSQAEEVIAQLDLRIQAVKERLRKNEKVEELALVELETLRDELVEEERAATGPIIDGYVIGSDIESTVEEPSAQLRAAYIGSQFVSSDSEAVGKINELRRDVEISNASIDLLIEQTELINQQLTSLQDVVADEQVLLGKITENAIHERGREGAVKAITATQNRGKKVGFYLDTCPVAGPHNFIDSWHFPRSGGRLHKGADIMSPRNTPVVAPTSGTVNMSSNNLGGRSFRLTSDTGTYFYGTHMDGYEGELNRRVNAGEVIGYVGDDGNARGTDPHLHFEIHPGGRGSPAINPYTDLAKVCAGAR